MKGMKAKDGILMSVVGVGLCAFAAGGSFGQGNAYLGTILIVLTFACALFLKGYIDDLKVKGKDLKVEFGKSKGQWGN